MRAFLAIAVPDDTRRAIGEAVAGVVEAHREPRWVRPENVHLTVAFLGWIDEALVPPIGERITPLAKATEPAELILGGVGAFPTGRPRVLWLGLAQGGPWFVALAQRARMALEDGLGLELDRRVPSAHATLARLPRPDRSALAALEAAFEGRTFSWRAGHLTLYSSVLGRVGPTYAVVREWPFGA